MTSIEFSAKLDDLVATALTSGLDEGEMTDILSMKIDDLLEDDEEEEDEDEDEDNLSDLDKPR